MFANYLADLFEVAKVICCTNHDGCKLDTSIAIKQIVLRLQEYKVSGNKIIWVGNGGSAAIASHSAVDYMRTAGIKTQSFFDASQLTCLSNDFGYAQVFAKPIEVYAEKGDLLVAISSSGRSENITNAVNSARKAGCWIITLSGFSPDNPLREMGDFNFYAPSSQYGQVELIHGILCHSFLDILMQEKSSSGSGANA